MSDTTNNRTTPVTFQLRVPETPEEAVQVLQIITGLGMSIECNVEQEIAPLDQNPMAFRVEGGDPN